MKPHRFKPSRVTFRGARKPPDVCQHEARTCYGVRVCHKPRSASVHRARKEPAR